MKMKTIIAAAVMLTLFTIGGCKTVPESIDEDLTPIEYFQLGQEASDKSNYEAALLYYKTFIERFPDDSQRIVEAEFEIAFIYHKLEDEATAREMYQAILDKYSQPGAELLPAWPRVLSEKLLKGENPDEVSVE